MADRSKISPTHSPNSLTKDRGLKMNYQGTGASGAALKLPEISPNKNLRPTSSHKSSAYDMRLKQQQESMMKEKAYQEENDREIERVRKDQDDALRRRDQEEHQRAMREVERASQFTPAEDYEAQRRKQERMAQNRGQ